MISSKFKFRHAPCLHGHVTGHAVCRHSFILELVRERDSINIYLLAYRTARFTSFPFTLLYSHLSFHFTPSPFHLTFSSLLLGLSYSKFSFLFLWGLKYSGLKKLFLLASHFILLRLESKRCPLTLASVLACGDSTDDLRF